MMKSNRLFLISSCLLMNACTRSEQFGAGVGSFTSKNVATTRVVASHSWQTSSLSSQDLAASVSGSLLSLSTPVYGDVGGVESFGVAAGLRPTLAPVLTVRGASDFSLSLSEYDKSFASTPSGQAVFQMNTQQNGNSFSWPTSVSGFTPISLNLYSGATPYAYSFAPQMAQHYGGAGALIFLGQEPTTVSGSTATTQHDLFAWVRAAGSNTWIGANGLGLTAKKISSSAATTVVDNRTFGISRPNVVHDYAGGFFAFWNGTDATHAYTGNRYRPWSGWNGEEQATLPGGYSNDDPDSLSFSASVSPTGAAIGSDAGFLQDGSGYGWYVQVSKVADYTLLMTQIDAVTSALSTASTDLAVNVAGKVILSPKMFVQPLTTSGGSSFGAVNIFYVSATAGAASGTVKQDVYTYNYTTGATSSNTGPSVASATDSTFNYVPARADVGTTYGEVPSIILKTSPNGKKALVAWMTTNSTIQIMKFSGSSFVDWGTLSSPTGFPAYQFDAAVDDSGDAILMAAWESAVGLTLSEVYGYKALSQSGGSWDSGTKAQYGSYYCDLATVKIAVSIDNSANGAAAITCIPYDSTATQVMIGRNFMVNFL